MRRTRRLGAGMLVLLALCGCKADTPTDLGAPLRSAPDSLRSVDLMATLLDTVFTVPVSLGRSTTPQVGQRGPYTAHVLYAMEMPTFTVDELGDTLRLDSATLNVALNATLGDAPFNGVLRLGLGEVQPGARGWSPDSILTALPPLTGVDVAPEITLASAGFDDDDNLAFALDLPSLTDYDSVFASGDSLVVNVALQFRGFDAGTPGFLEYSYGGSSPTASISGFSDDEPSGAILTARPLKQLTVVEYDTTYTPGTNWLVSDGHRQHTWVLFESVSSVLPPTAFVYRADFVFTQVDSASGLSFGIGPSIGVMVPTDTSQVYETSQNTLGLSFSSAIANVPGSQVSINVTAYFLDQQEGTVENSGMILRLSNEGSKVRQFEFHGAHDANPARRPRVRLIYSLPADFGGGS